jgi:hypothetical protein
MKTILIATAALFLLISASCATASGRSFYFMVIATTGVAQAGPFSSIQACNNARGTVSNLPAAAEVSDCYSAQ